MSIEKWLPIKGYEGIYNVSSHGRVKSLSRTSVGKDLSTMTIKERILKLNIIGLVSEQYFSVNLCRKGKCKTKTVHQLVAIAFLDHKPNGLKIVVDHKDNNKLNNHIDNLQIISNRENTSKDKKGCSSKYTGVYLHKRTKKWRAAIYVNGKSKHLGLFNCELEASESYQKKLKEINNGNIN